jgi:uncharacterized protein (DUF488 family)
VAKTHIQLVMPQLFTVGYAGLDRYALRAKLEATNAVLVDVRLIPYSREPAWTRPALQGLLGERYVWVGALGNRNYKTGGPIDLADPEAGIAAVRGVVDSYPAVVLMCACWSWRECHRRDAAELLSGRLGMGPAVHWIAADVAGGDAHSLPINEADS